MPELTSTNHPIWCMVALGTSACCQLKNFLTSKRKGQLQHAVDNEVSALAMLAFNKNLLIGQEISVRVSLLNGLNLEKMH